MNNTNSLAHTKWNCKYHIVLGVSKRESFTIITYVFAHTGNRFGQSKFRSCTNKPKPLIRHKKAMFCTE